MDTQHWIGVRSPLPKGLERIEDALVSLSPQELRTHAHIIGSTGSGKTTLIHHLIAQDILLGRSFIVLDLRGDLVCAALELCAGRVPPELLAHYDLRERERPLGFDPLGGGGEPYFRALGFLGAVEAEADGWGVQLAETLRNAALLLAGTGEPLTQIEGIFHDAGLREGMLARCAEEPVRGFWERYGELSRDRQAALASPVLNKVSLLLSTQGLRQMLGSPKPLDLRRHLDRKGSATLISLAADELHGAGRMMGNIMLASICREAFSRVNVPVARRNPVRLYVDEFEHFTPYLFEQILAEGRKYGLTLVVAHQTMAQLAPRFRSLLLNGVGAKAAFRTGRDDGAALSRGITGDAHALDLPSLPVGHAVLWRTGQGWLEVEVNAPLVQPGQRSEAALSLIEELRNRNPLPQEQPQGRCEECERRSREKGRKGGPSRRNVRLEDWL